MRNWLLEIKNWLTIRFSRLMKSINTGGVEATPSETPVKIASTEQINFQASSLRKSRPLASGISRQSITIPVPARPKAGIEERKSDGILSTVLASETTALNPTEALDAPSANAEIASSHVVIESDLPLPIPKDGEEATDEDEDAMATPAESTETLAEQAAIQTTQSEAVFTVINAEDSSIEVQVRGESMSLAAALESLLFVSDTSVEVSQFVKLFSLDAEVIQSELAKLGEQFKQTRRGIRLQEQNGRYRLISLPAAANLIETFLNLDLTTRLSGPALETLSVIAYRQPVTRAAIEAVRGVDCGYVLRSLLQRGLVEESGRLETVGRPILYSVTEQFMQHFGLTTLNDLPPLESTEAALLMQVTEMEEAHN